MAVRRKPVAVEVHAKLPCSVLAYSDKALGITSLDDKIVAKPAFDRLARLPDHSPWGNELLT